MRYIVIITLLVLCLTLLLLIGCMINVEGPVIVIEEDAEATGTVYPQKWATGDGTAENPWANDCIKKAYTACPAGGTVYLKAGYYQLAGVVTVVKAINIIGEGMDKTFIVTADDFGFKMNADYITLKGFTIDGDAQTENANTSYCIAVENCDYITLENVEVKNCGRIGINILNVNHSLFQNIYAHDSHSHGVHPGSSSAGRNQYNAYDNIYAWNNELNGFDDWSSVVSGNNTYNNLNCWDNTKDGIALTNLIGITLSNSSASGNGENGMFLTTIEDSTINNCSVTLNDGTGIFLTENCSNVNFTNVIVKNNLNGITIYNSSDIAWTTCQSYDDRETPLQGYGLQLYGTNTGISLLNCKLSPNKDGEIYNPAGVVLTVITKKKGSFSFCHCEGMKRLKQSLLAIFLKLKSKNYKLLYLTFPIFL